MNPRIAHLEARRFGRLYVVRFYGTIKGRSYWLCLCKCGVQKIISSHDLLRKKRSVQSCGCLKKDGAGKDGRTRFLAYDSYKNMRLRCLDPENKWYSEYGARGITICDRWRDSFENFLADMGDRPGKEFTLERRDNEKGYGPENCYWATHQQQQRNTRHNRLITHNGETHPLVVWCERFNLNYRAIQGRLHRGWSAERALTTPTASPYIPNLNQHRGN
ncbi:MAG TPA: hypothetical protein VKE94_14685 [Gemmataceae bacterium]|nr:hypothetical protein [Gemmataceae bacterium]